VAVITAVLSRQTPPALRADPVHDRVIDPLVIELEVHAVSPEAGHAKDVPALGADEGPCWICLRCGRLAIGWRDRRLGCHLVTALLGRPSFPHGDGHNRVEESLLTVA
jgi:hypothetical protein